MPKPRKAEAPAVGSGYDPFALAQQFDQMRIANTGGPAVFQMPVPQPVVQRFDKLRQAVLPTAAGWKKGTGTYDQWVDQIAKIKGLTPQERQAFYALGMGESGGRNIPQGIVDINTKKGTPAFGPWQVIRPTFERYKEPGYDDWHDPIANGLASINYQRARYGKLRSRPGY